jgi:hypothetical protein
MLSQTLLRVRRALGEGAADQSAIRTVTKFGYRWVAPTQVEPRGGEATTPAPAQADAIDAADDNASLEPTPSRDAAIVSAPRERRFAAVAAALAVLVLIAFGLAWRSGVRREAPNTTAAPVGVDAFALVLPVELNADASWDWLRFGLMDLIAARLRDGGVNTLDSKNLYVLLGNRPDIAKARPDAELGLPAISRQRIYVRATLANAKWQVELVSIEADRRVEASADGDDITASARLAADRLLLALGHTPASFANTSSSVQ